MAEPATAGQGARFDGVVTVRDAGARGMIALRGDLADPRVQAAVEQVTGLPVPERNAAQLSGREDGVVWMAPDELLLLTGYARAAAAVDALRTALEGLHCLVAEMSDARALFVVEGPAVRDVLAKLTPADLRVDRFGPGQARRTRLAQVAGGLWMRDAETVEVICFRSVAGYVFDLLSTAAAPGGDVACLARST